MPFDFRERATNDYVITGAGGYGKMLQDCLLAAGFVRVSAAVDWSAIASEPGFSANNLIGTAEVWRFDDSLQADFPVFFRIEWRFGSSGPNKGLRLELGTGWSSGVALTGQLTILNGPATIVPAIGPYGGQELGVFNAFEHGFTVSRVCGSSSANFTLGLERVRGFDGVYRGHVAYWSQHGASGANGNAMPWCVVFKHPASTDTWLSQPVVGAGRGVMFLTPIGSQSTTLFYQHEDGAGITTGPYFVGPVLWDESRLVKWVPNYDYLQNTEYELSIGGVEKTFRSAQLNVTTQSGGNAPSSQAALWATE